MSNTIHISGIGWVEIETQLKEIYFCGGVTADGAPVNCIRKTVSRSKKNAAAAIRNRGWMLEEIKPGYYKLVKLV